MAVDETPIERPDLEAIKRQEKISRDVATALRRTAEIKRQVKEIEDYFATIKRDNK